MSILYARNHPSDDFATLLRRGFELGWVKEDQRPTLLSTEHIVAHWQQDKAVLLPGLLLNELTQNTTLQAHIQQAHQLMQTVLETAQLSASLEMPPYANQFTRQSSRQFALVASSFEEHDEQAIEKVYFDAEEHDQCVAEDLWCKASWLSFLADDASLRFRFSFGMECLQDVAADPLRQRWAGKLCDAMFPESGLLTDNHALLSILQAILGTPPAFVERIVYFNAPGGGAQMHHDVERGHDGVVFGQLSGSTFWLTLAKSALMDELIAFCIDPRHEADITAVLPAQNDRGGLQRLLQNRTALADYMEEADHEWVEAIIDRSPAFIAQLIEHGYGHILQAGDVLLMPQRNLDHCVWHSVCCLDDEPGEALSFAIRSSDAIAA